MAEGGVPLEPEQYYQEVEEVNSLELIFSRDFITYVINRQLPKWKFKKYLGVPCPVTPFSYRIRKAVDFYMNKEWINLDTLFLEAFQYDPCEFEGFVRVVRRLIIGFFPSVRSSYDLLRFLCLYANFAARARRYYIKMAPYYVLHSMKDLLRTYIEGRGITPDDFFAEFGYEVIRIADANRSIVSR